MCIRDRPGDRLIILPSSGVSHTVSSGQTLGQIASLYGVEAVSYTHLRAHETVLDLVCRLLLEKKKNKLTYKPI